MLLRILLLLILATPSSTLAETVNISANTAELHCLAKAVYFEANGSNEKMQTAVADVVINRVRDERYPDTICEVVQQKTGKVCQFSWYCGSHPIKYLDRWKRALTVAKQTLTEYVSHKWEDTTNGATHFHDTSIKPAWSYQMTRTLRVENLIFYGT